jgi:hypothetical protein
MTTVLEAPVHQPAAVEPVIAVVLDYRHARFFVDDATGLRELPRTYAARMRGGRFHAIRGNAPGKGEKHFHQVRIEETRRLFKAIAARLAAVIKSERGMGVVIGGSHRIVAEFRTACPKAIDRIVIKTANMNPKAVRKLKLQEMAEAARSLTPEGEKS